jgi:hypothetical protein
MTKSALAVEIDGTPLPADEARALWEEFSQYLDEHELDFDGFAKRKGFTSVRPTHKGGRALLLVETGRTKARAPTASEPQPRPRAKPAPGAAKPAARPAKPSPPAKGRPSRQEKPKKAPR